MVEETGGAAVPADDVAAIVAALRRLAAGQLQAPKPGAGDAYSYPAVAERMAEVAEGAVASARARRPPRRRWRLVVHAAHAKRCAAAYP